MHAQDLPAALARHLDAEIAAAQALFDTLSAEREALKGTHAAALETAGAAKVAALATFEKLEQARRLLGRAGGLASDDRAAFERWLEALDRQSMLLTSWRRLLELTARCRDANQTNGLIVGHRQVQVRQLLGLLRGASGAETYGPSGARSTPATSARALARA